MSEAGRNDNRTELCCGTGRERDGCWPLVMIKNTIIGICSEIMQIVWGKRQETLLDRTGSSIGREVVTRAAGIGAEEGDSVGEGGHRES